MTPGFVDPANFAQPIATLIDDADRWAELSEAAMQHARSEFAMDTHVTRLLAALEGVIAV